MGDIVLKEVENNEFNQAKLLVRNGLLEYTYEIFKVTTLHSKVIQVIFFLLSFLLTWMINFSLMKLIGIFLLLEVAAYFFIRYQWIYLMNLELSEMNSWTEFLQEMRKEKFNRLWVAIEQSSGNVIGTIGVRLFGNYKTVKTCGVNVEFNDGEFSECQHYISVELKRFSVAPSYRGTGLSQRLLDKTFEYVSQQRKKNVFISKIVLFANAAQYAAMKIYKRNGFEKSNSWDLPHFMGLSSRSISFYEKKFSSNE